MNSALNDGASDLIGLGRPLTAEPHLCAELISGVKTAAKPNHASPTISTALAVMQIHQIARGEPISDLSTEENALKAQSLLASKL
jgi:2,4-dienoyl-CoA reductase-like NADH-dependent reductase (Old Yellow Enzyme family)